jgi:hypothetical protein
MKKLYGWVFVKETDSGVPNLVVAAYDSDRGIDDLIADHGNEKGFSPQVMGQLGKRIGSVLTDHDGKFTINSEDLQFQGNESRPDLLIIVFAPEDIQGVDRPFPLTPEKRILYISSIPRIDAGSEEAYIIRLLQAQLDKFQIPSSASRDSRESEIDSNVLFNAIQRSYNFRDNLKQKLAPRLKLELDHSIEIKKKAKDKLRDFSAIPISLRNHPLLIKDIKELADKQKQVIVNGLSRLNNYKGALRMTLDDKEIKSLGLKTDEKGDTSGQVKTDNLLDIIMSKTGGTDLVRIRDLSDSSISPINLLQKYTPNSDKPDDSKDNTIR